MNNWKYFIFSVFSVFAGKNGQAAELNKEELPNILWITSEDNGPMLGCYGDTFATTPNLDRLAGESFRYTHAYASAPVSAPARNTIITGVYACSAGNQHMRSWYGKSDTVRYYPEFLRKLGYYCTNNPKEDYNNPAEQTRDIWDESGRNAHYRNRKPGQPFFAVFNSVISHESCIHNSIPPDKLRHDPNQVALPPYHPDTKELRHDWAQYYDKIEDMDAWVGEILKDLEESGEADNTIVFYYSDHGGVLCRSKRFVYETGTHVPFIVRIPEKFKHLYPGDKLGTTVDRLIGWVDLAPTLLNIAGIPIPEWMQGKAFLGHPAATGQEYVFMFRDRMDERYDMSRAIRDKRFRYIRNYQPHRIYGQHNNYLWLAPSVASWENAYKSGSCNQVESVFWEEKPAEELYDTEMDVWEIHNLAGNPDYGQILDRMRNALNEKMICIRDAGFIQEGEYERINERTTMYDYLHSPEYPIAEIVHVANAATMKDKKNLPDLVKWLKSDNRIIRYWAATGLLILGEEAESNVAQLTVALRDPSPDVAIVAAEALYRLGQRQRGVETLLTALENPNVMVRTFALNVIDNLDEDSFRIRQAVENLGEKSKNDKSQERYDLRMVNRLTTKWRDDVRR
ncbi:MAG: sulfatase-like hydrolase/transferase [Tannerella sp.]|jgi:arylsulfatase A-like enzyme|nr:sulfatase-like hydrolase/transferase [Tannerella sp.]